MKNNPFDDLGYSDQQLDGLFSGLKKAIKKLNPVNVLKETVKGAKSVHRAHINAVKNPKAEIKKRFAQGVKHIKDVDKFRLEAEAKIDKTLYGNKLGSKLIKLRHSKEARGAELVVGAAVASYFGGPLAGKAIMGLTKGAITKSAAIKGAQTFIKLGVPMVTKQLKEKKENELLTAQQQNEIANATNWVLSELAKDFVNIEALQNDKDFIAVVEGLLKRGASWAEIEAAWANSDTYQHLVRTEVPRTVQPMIYADMINAGIPKGVAQRESYIQSHEMTDNAASELATKKTIESNPLLIAIPLAFALFS